MKPIPEREYLNQLFSYDPNSGLLTWKTRPAEHFKSVGYARRWNMRHAGSLAGNKAAGKRSSYRKVRIDYSIYFAHRVIFCKEIRKLEVWEEINHIDGDGLNNRLCNLRVVTSSENSRNTPLRRTNTSGRVGVQAKRGRWQAKIIRQGVRYELGTFASFEEACKARAAAELVHSFHPNHGRI